MRCFSAVLFMICATASAKISDLTLKNCDNLSNEFYYMHPPVLTPDRSPDEVFAEYDAKKEQCEKLREAVSCEKWARHERAEKIFFMVNRQGQINPDLSDLVTAELICTRRQL